VLLVEERKEKFSSNMVAVDNQHPRMLSSTERIVRSCGSPIDGA